MIIVWVALGIALAASGLIVAISIGICEADREDLAIQPSTWSALLARRVVRLYVRRAELTHSAEVDSDPSDWAAA
jgi:hypothetical protein